MPPGLFATTLPAIAVPEMLELPFCITPGVCGWRRTELSAISGCPPAGVGGVADAVLDCCTSGSDSVERVIRDRTRFAFMSRAPGGRGRGREDHAVRARA